MSKDTNEHSSKREFDGIRSDISKFFSCAPSIDTNVNAERDIQRPMVKSFEKLTQQNQWQLNEYNSRDCLYTNLLESFRDIYLTSATSNKKLKSIFFWFVILTFTSIILCSFALAIIAIFNLQNVITQITTLITALGTIIVAVIKLPEIIAEYLFHKDEQIHNIEMIQNFQKNDSKIRSAMLTGTNDNEQ